jgi:hypothetical protein
MALIVFLVGVSLGRRQVLAADGPQQCRSQPQLLRDMLCHPSAPQNTVLHNTCRQLPSYFSNY